MFFGVWALGFALPEMFVQGDLLCCARDPVCWGSSIERELSVLGSGFNGLG